MPKNYNIVTKHVYLSAVAKASQRKAIGSSVAAGMTRYVTMVRVKQTKASGLQSHGSKVYLCSVAAQHTASTTTAASAGAKMQIYIQSVAGNTNVPVLKVKQIPDIPDTENPLFTIAASKWFTAFLCSGATQSGPVHVFAQYYDQ